MTRHLVTTTATESAARTLKKLIIYETEIFPHCIVLEGSAVWIDSPKTISKPNIQIATALGRGFAVGYSRAVRTD